MKERDYQRQAIIDVNRQWEEGNRNVCLVLPTGAGKTFTASLLIKEMDVPTMCIAHRQELVVQISDALASCGIQHRVIAPNAVQKLCAKEHMKKYGTAYTHGTDTMVASVQTLLSQQDKLRQYFGRIKLWFTDESHHLLPTNQWGKATNLFPNAIGLGVTATPLRCDRKGLDGVLDALVVGPTMRDLINQGHLSDYRIFCPPVSFDADAVRVSKSTGEFIKADLADATHESSIVGDVVHHYTRIAYGQRGLTFCVDLEAARATTDAYNAAGIPARYVDGDTPDRERIEILEMLKSGEIWQVVNVDLFGEGFDAPAVSVVSMARPTQSFGLYCQQFGRALRIAPGKTHAIIIDHVGNVVRHGLPDAPRNWTLEGGRRDRTDDDPIPMTVCEMCMQPRRAVIRFCPFCGHKNEPQERSSPAAVAGDLVELDPVVLQAMRGQVIDLDNDWVTVPNGASAAVAGRRAKDHRQLHEAQRALRDTMALWAGQWHAQGEDLDALNIRFWHTFGTDPLSAMAMRKADAEKLKTTIEGAMK